MSAQGRFFRWGNKAIGVITSLPREAEKEKGKGCGERRGGKGKGNL